MFRVGMPLNMETFCAKPASQRCRPCLGYACRSERTRPLELFQKGDLVGDNPMRRSSLAKFQPALGSALCAAPCRVVRGDGDGEDRRSGGRSTAPFTKRGPLDRCSIVDSTYRQWPCPS